MTPDQLRAIVEEIDRYELQYGYIMNREREARLLARTLLAVLERLKTIQDSSSPSETFYGIHWQTNPQVQQDAAALVSFALSILADAEAGKEAVGRRSPLAIATAWYSYEEIQESINRHLRDKSDSAPPRDVTSAEFSFWLTLQYRLAMAKGIQLGRDRSEDKIEVKHG